MATKRFSVVLAKLRHGLFRPLDFGGLVGGVIFFALAMTPTMIPRSWKLQGLLAGLTAAIGYGLGSFLFKYVSRLYFIKNAKQLFKRQAWQTLLVFGPLLMFGSVLAGQRWDKQLRDLMFMELKEPWQVVSMVVLSIVFTLILIGVGRIIKGFFHLLYRLANKIMPQRTAKLAGYGLALFFIVYVLLGGLAKNLFSAIDYAASVANDTIQTNLTPPISPLRSGSPQSLISWENLGAKGREFISGGPRVEDINNFFNFKLGARELS